MNEEMGSIGENAVLYAFNPGGIAVALWEIQLQATFDPDADRVNIRTDNHCQLVAEKDLVISGLYLVYEYKGEEVMQDVAFGDHNGNLANAIRLAKGQVLDLDWPDPISVLDSAKAEEWAHLPHERGGTDAPR